MSMLNDAAARASRAMIASAVLAVCAGMLCARASAFDAERISEGDYVIENFRFSSGAVLPELRLHYTTFGQPHHDAGGHIDNAVLMLHDTVGSSRDFQSERVAGVLFGRGQLLDKNRFFLIFPDAIGHGRSSRPSDGLHGQFPKYGYQDMVDAQYALVVQGLQVDHLRLLLGTAMGCMHAWMWAEQRADFVDAVMPLGCLPVAVAGRNRVWRELIVRAIRTDPDWHEGDYKSEPRAALAFAAAMLLIAGSAPIQMQTALPNAAAATEFVDRFLALQTPELDANDLLYQIDAAKDYDPSAALEQIHARLMWINSADDFLDPPELGIAEREIRRVKNGQFVLLPASEQTRGHGTGLNPVLWKSYLEQLLRTPAR